jgi:hypothetical protein
MKREEEEEEEEEKEEKHPSDQVALHYNYRYLL